MTIHFNISGTFLLQFTGLLGKVEVLQYRLTKKEWSRLEKLLHTYSNKLSKFHNST